jgi:beta-lactamase regulating signal transducer with metallopeptidase domain/5-hydroxyisourate hydrolase-like protein (transthyretin family)
MEAFSIELTRYLAAQSWQIAFLAATVAAATFALRRRSAHVRYLLWLVVVTKCLVPPLHVVPLQVLPSPVAPAETTVAASLPTSTPEPAASSNPVSYDSYDTTPTQVVEKPALVPPVPQATAHRWPTSVWLGALWIVGAGVYLLMNLLRALRGHYWLRRTRRPLPETVQADAVSLLRPYGVWRLPRIWIMEGVGQPFVWGLLRGGIYVPPGFLSIENPTHRRDILAHELSHVLRCDAAVNTLQVIAQGLFWFHPCVWWTNRMIRREREKCCDEMVIARTGTTPKDYSAAIVEALARAKQSAYPVPSLAVASPLKHIEERIRTLLTPGRRFYRRPGLAVAMLIVLVALLAVPTAFVLTAKARDAEQELNDVLAKYEAAREAAQSRYLMIVKDNSELTVTWQDGPRHNTATYRFAGLRRVGPIESTDDAWEVAALAGADAGDTITSILAWTKGRMPEIVTMEEGTQGYSLLHDPFDRFTECEYSLDPLNSTNDAPLYWPSLQGLGWPAVSDSYCLVQARRLVLDDRYALDHDLTCIEIQGKETIVPGEEFPTITRFYLNPARNYMCQRWHRRQFQQERWWEDGQEVTEYAQTPGGQWYPRRIREYYVPDEQERAPRPDSMYTVVLDTEPTFPAGIFSREALRTRFASVIVSDPPGEPPRRDPEPNASQRRVAGRVLVGETHRPIANARVRVTVSGVAQQNARVATEHIGLEDGTKSEIYETRTDPDGWFEMLIPDVDAKGRVTIDAMAPGYGTAARNSDLFDTDLSRRWAEDSEESPDAATSNLTIRLARTIYVAGVVKDVQGTPVAHVEVKGVVRAGGRSHTVANTETDAEGRFEVFDFPLEIPKRRIVPAETDTHPPAEINDVPIVWRERPKLQEDTPDGGELRFGARTTVTGIYDMSDEERASLVVTVPRGLRITGTVLDADGRPAGGVRMNTMEPRSLGSRIVKHTTTDSNGHFEFAGLEPGRIELRTCDLAVNQGITLAITLKSQDEDLTLKMKPIESKSRWARVTLFGMRLANVPFESWYMDASNSEGGVLILDPGPNPSRLGIGELQKGYRLDAIEGHPISSLLSLLCELLNRAIPVSTDKTGESPQSSPPIGVSYLTPTGTYMGYLTLTRDDVEELKRVAEELGITPPGNDP